MRIYFKINKKYFLPRHAAAVATATTPIAATAAVVGTLAHHPLPVL